MLIRGRTSHSDTVLKASGLLKRRYTNVLSKIAGTVIRDREKKIKPDFLLSGRENDRYWKDEIIKAYV